VSVRLSSFMGALVAEKDYAVDALFPRGTRSVLFFGTQGTGTFCYGEGTADKSLVGKPTSDGSTWCYDPDGSSKGTHAYPYVAEVWAYDVAELAAVHRGAKFGNGTDPVIHAFKVVR
jgi:hypothetical protein